MSTTVNSNGTVTIEIAGMEVTLPVRFSAGQIITENQAKVLDAAYQRQFTNNQNALAKARTDGSNKTAQPDADGLAALYQDYEPSIGGSRTGSMEKNRQEAAWRFWTAHVKDHNDSIQRGGEPVIVKAGKQAVALPRNTKEVPARDNLVASLLAHPDYQDRIQTYLDMILAEKGKGAATATAQVSATDLL